MTDALSLRNSKLEELRRLKAKKCPIKSDSEQSDPIPSAFEGIKEEISIEKPSNPSSVIQDSELEQMKKELSQIPYLEIEELVIKQLKIQLDILAKNESNLIHDSEIMQEENFKLHRDREMFLNSHEDLKKMCESLQRDLEQDLEKVRLKSRSLNNPKAQSRHSYSQEIQELQSELQLLHTQIQEKDEEIDYLGSTIQRIRQESSELCILLNTGGYSSQPEPPPPVYPSRRLLSDVGSTGTWSAHQKAMEESKTQFASPDPFENLFHQSTGETSQHNKEEPATPPNEYAQEYEERKHYMENEEEKIGTPKRKAVTKTNFYVS